MAAASAEITGVPGVVLTGLGPGAAAAANGVAYAHLDRASARQVYDGEMGDGPMHPELELSESDLKR